MIVEWLYYKAATCSAIVKCDLMHPLWVSILRGLYLGQNSPSRLQLGRHLSLIIVIFLFGLRKWNYYSALSLPTPLFSKVCIYIHVNCGLLIISNKIVTYQEPKDFYSTCEQLDSGISWRGTHPCSSSCSRVRISLQWGMWGCQGGQGCGFCCLQQTGGVHLLFPSHGATHTITFLP